MDNSEQLRVNKQLNMQQHNRQLNKSTCSISQRKYRSEKLKNCDFLKKQVLSEILNNSHSNNTDQNTEIDYEMKHIRRSIKTFEAKVKQVKFIEKFLKDMIEKSQKQTKNPTILEVWNQQHLQLLKDLEFFQSKIQPRLQFYQKKLKERELKLGQIEMFKQDK